MAQFNRIILIGKILNTPDIKVSTEGKSIAKFNIEAERAFGDKKDIIPIVCFERLADTAEGFSKAQMILVEGRIQQRTFEDEEGNTVWSTEVVASLLKSFDSQNNVVKNDKVIDKEEETEDDIPF